jgi:HD-GYP domain-containing protein (c-di-GMP phosphodiesterase class II)
LGAQAIRRLGPDADWIAELVLQEHERLGGLGYPRGLKGDEIHEYAQVIGLADTFEALLHARPYRKRFLPHEAVRELVTKEKTAFPTKMLKCLIQQFSVFPLGTRIRLNTGETAEVVELNPQYPLRPVVKVHKDPHGLSPKETRTLDLSKSSLVHVTEVVQDDQ